MSCWAVVTAEAGALGEIAGADAAVSTHAPASVGENSAASGEYLAILTSGTDASGEAGVGSKAPIKIAVFPFELEDFSAAEKQGGNPYLAEATEEAKRQLVQSGRYSVVDTVGVDVGAAKKQGLRNCNGCEAPIAMKLGAVGVLSKISMTEYLIKIQVRDARTGEIVSTFATDLRMAADYSWSRGVRWLMQNSMLAAT